MVDALSKEKVPSPPRHLMAMWIRDAWELISEDDIKAATQAGYFPAGLAFANLLDTEYFGEASSDSSDSEASFGGRCGGAVVGLGGAGKELFRVFEAQLPTPSRRYTTRSIDVHIYCGSRMSHEVETSATWDARSSPCFVGKLPPVPLPHTDPSRRGARWRCVTGPCTGTAPEQPCRWPGIRFYWKPSRETVVLPETCEMVWVGGWVCVSTTHTTPSFLGGWLRPWQPGKALLPDDTRESSRNQESDQCSATIVPQLRVVADMTRRWDELNPGATPSAQI